MQEAGLIKEESDPAPNVARRRPSIGYRDRNGDGLHTEARPWPRRVAGKESHLSMVQTLQLNRALLFTTAHAVAISHLDHVIPF
jgi:hypothetical protein